MNKFLRLLVKIIFFIIIISPALIFSVIMDAIIIIFYIIYYCIITIYNFGFNKPFVSIKEYMKDLDFLTVTLYKLIFTNE